MISFGPAGPSLGNLQICKFWMRN